MNNPLVRGLIVLGIVVVGSLISQQLRIKLVKPSYKNNIQTPGKFYKRTLILFNILTGTLVVFMLLGLIINNIEMAVVNAVLALIIIGITLFLKRKYDISYQENDEFFILNAFYFSYGYDYLLDDYSIGMKKNQ